MAASSSSFPATATATDNLLEQKYDVFLSFRGVDTRAIFTSHLYAALDRRKIPTYMDDKSLESGGDIGPALLKAIEQSRLSIIIFSKEYASSAWCLNELVQILKTKETCGQVVIPVFYDTDPAHVRRQTGTYGEAFTKHEERYDTDTMSMWRKALTTAANLSGFDSQNFRDQADLIKKITEVILLKLDLKGLVGAERRIEKIESLLSIHTEDIPVRSVGIWGTGGIGKTTLAEAIYYRHFHKFEACSFLANITERTKKYGLEHLKNKLLCDLLKEDYSSIKAPSIDSILDKKLSLTKVLIVLDDVSESEQSKVLLLDQVQFGPGSRIIITSRNMEALLGLVDHTYEVERLGKSESHLLFRSIAFEDHKSLSSEYSDWSSTVVGYSQGIPLALRVLGSLFRECNTKWRWERELQSLKNMSNEDIKNVLRLRYDRLEENDKKIFLDIACFLKGMKICEAERLLKMHGLDPQGIGNLSSAHLISISKEKYLKIHDLVEELGKDIIAGEGAPARWSRVWKFSVLKDCPDPLAVEALFLDISDIRKRQLIGEALFKRMPELRLLKFYVPRESYEAYGEKKGLNVTLNYSSIKKELPGAKDLKDQCKAMYTWHIGGLSSLPEPLTYLYWDGYPLKYLPKYYSPDNLVELHLPYSRLEHLLKPKKPIDPLKVVNLAFHKKSPNKPLKLEVINLRYSKNLMEVPDLSWCPSVERLDLSGCTSLLNLNYSGGVDKNSIGLKELLLCWCINLVSVPHTIYLFSLETLDLRGCRKLKELPRSSGGQYFSSLRRLNLSWCDKLKIHDGLICLPSLEEICLSGTMIESIPASIKKSSKLRKLVVKNCQKLQYLPELPPLLEILEADGCTSLKTVAISNNNAFVQDGAPYCSPQDKLMLTKSLDERRKNELLEDVDLERLMFTKSLDQSLKSELLEYVAHVNETSGTSFSVSLSRSDEFQLQAKGRSRGPRFESDHGSPNNGPWLGERRIFSNCFRLEESSRINITEDTQLRIKRIASSEREYGTVFATCPGDNIPPWFSYRQEGCSINIKCPQTDEKLSGFAVSVVFATQNEGLDYLFQLRCDCRLKTDDREVYEFLQFESPLVLSMKNSDSTSGNLDDNVLIFFQKDMFRRSTSVPLDKVTWASFSFSLQCCYGGEDDQVKVRVRRVRVKKCGIKILYAQ